MKRTDPKENPFASLANAVACHSRDWSDHGRDAWIYGIVCGWNRAAMAEVAKDHGWSPETVARLRWLRRAFVLASRRAR